MAARQPFASLVQAAGVIGAGGGGFPTHVKLAGQADTVVANDAECEPLLYKDTHLTELMTARVIRGLQLSMAALGAERGIIGIKEKHAEAIAALQGALPADGSIKLHFLGDYYPSGDEFDLVQSTTGRLIPPAGLPLQVGVVVHNVETLVQLADAAEGKPVVDKWVTVTGAVAHPQTFRVPLGVTFGELIELCGGATVPNPVAMLGGAMMGRVCTDFSQPVTKTTGGLIVLDRDHPLMARKMLPPEAKARRGKSACDQCSHCTEMCSRHLLGYEVQPHRVMRSLAFTKSGQQSWNVFAALCSGCGLCTYFSCPEQLYPKETCDTAKAELRAAGIKWTGTGQELKVHPMQDGRRVPVKRLVERLALTPYNQDAPYTDAQPNTKRFTFVLKAHVGAPAVPVVKVGDSVQRGQVIAEIAEGKLGARVHCSVDGRVVEIGESWGGSIIVERV